MIGIVRAHLEEDAAKTVHVGGRTAGSAARTTRSSTTPRRRRSSRSSRHRTSARPTRRSGFGQLLRQTIVELGISDADGEGDAADGRQRLRAPRRVRQAADATELKNMNSFNFVAAASRRRSSARSPSGSGRRGAAGDVRLRRRYGVADAAAREGGGGRPRYFPEPDLVPPAASPSELVERLRRGVARARPRGSAGSRASSTSSAMSSTGGLDALWGKSPPPAPSGSRRRT